jgi:tetratricopeptide (TPR) repeat protein
MSAPGPAGDAHQTKAATAVEPDGRGDSPQPIGGASISAAGDRPPHVKRLRTFLNERLRSVRFWVVTLFLVALLSGGLWFGVPHARAWYHFHAGRSALQKYHNPQAVRHLQSCLRDWPDDPDVQLLAARAARRARAYDEAERLLEKYGQARGLDDAYSFEQLLLSAERDVTQAAPVCRRYVEQDHPDTPLILEALTRGYLRQYRLSEAKFCLDLWLEKQPDNPQALCFQGEFHLDYEKAPDRALKSYRRAVELDPENEEARQGLAIVLLDSKSFSEALEHIEYVRRFQPENLRVQVGLAECREGLGERAEAVRLLDEVLAHHEQYVPALSLRGRIAVESGQYAEAEPMLRQAIALSPGDHQARYNLILCLSNTDRPDEAKRQGDALKQWENDVKRFNEIVILEMPKKPDDPNLHCTLGKLLLRSGHKEEGLRWLHSALRLDPQYEPARQALAEYYQQPKSKGP